MGYEMYRTLITLKSSQKPQFNSSTGNSNSNKKNTLTKYFQSQNSSTSNVIDLEEEDKQINRINGKFNIKTFFKPKIGIFIYFNFNYNY